MNDPIQHYLSSMKFLCPEIKDEHLIEFSKSLKVKNFNKKDTIFTGGDIQSDVVFISKGLVRTFYIDEKGDEKTSWFVKENEFVTDYPAYLTGKRSHYTFQVLEPTIALFLPKESIQKTYDQFPEVQKYGRLIAEEILKIQQGRIESFLFMDAKERYLQFSLENPDLLNRVSVGHIASYVGVERQSLTRIRKQLLNLK